MSSATSAFVSGVNHPKLVAKAVIIGASRGVGLELARQFAKEYNGQDQVVATMRTPDASLLPSSVAVEQLDLRDAESVKALAERFELIVSLDSWKGLYMRGDRP